MKVTERTITAIQEIVTGDKRLSPYRSGPRLVKLFNNYGANDVYGQGFPSRWSYAEDNLRRLNASPALAALLCEVLDPRNFANTEFDQQLAADHINALLRYDGFEIVLITGKPMIRTLDGASVEFTHPFSGSEEQGHVFIDEQLSKCEDKIRGGDFDGAITNARSLIEAILLELEKMRDSDPPTYDGDLIRLYKRVQKLLKLDPARPEVDTTTKQMLTGFVSVVNGVAGMSNQMGDRHARTHRPDKRHAVLVVNAVKTLAGFLWEAHLTES